MRYGSVCSGIEAATVAWRPLGWEPQWFAEIEPFPSAVLAHRFPAVRNYGDMTRIPDDAPDIDLLVGGTPCQSFSVAGLRGGMDDPRGNLALEYCRLAQRFRPHWLVWENVPGVLSSSGGRDFGALVGALVELGYRLAWRVLDAQYAGLAQRRKRVFLVGHLGGSATSAAAVLFERASMRGDPPPSREAGEEVAQCLTGGTGRRYDSSSETLIPQAFHARQDSFAESEQSPPLDTDGCTVGIRAPSGVRRLLPVECERLMGFPDDWTQVPYRGKPAADSPRYRAVGNSMAVPLMRWIGRRIVAVDACL